MEKYVGLCQNKQNSKQYDETNYANYQTKTKNYLKKGIFLKISQIEMTASK